MPEYFYCLAQQAASRTLQLVSLPASRMGESAHQLTIAPVDCSLAWLPPLARSERIQPGKAPSSMRSAVENFEALLVGTEGRSPARNDSSQGGSADCS